MFDPTYVGALSDDSLLEIAAEDELTKTTRETLKTKVAELERGKECLMRK